MLSIYTAAMGQTETQLSVKDIFQKENLYYGLKYLPLENRPEWIKDRS